MFSSVYEKIQNEVGEIEKAESIAPGQGHIVSMNNICKLMNCNNNLCLASELAYLVVDKSTLIEVETVNSLCECRKEDRLKIVKDCILGKKKEKRDKLTAFAGTC